MTLKMETTKSIVSKAAMERGKIQDDFSAERQPFQHEALQSLDNLNVESPKEVIAKDKLYALAVEVGMLKVLRWKPRLVCPPRFEICRLALIVGSMDANLVLIVAEETGGFRCGDSDEQCDHGHRWSHYTTARIRSCVQGGEGEIIASFT